MDCSTFWTISSKRGVCFFFNYHGFVCAEVLRPSQPTGKLPWFTEIPVLNANSIYPDQTPHYAASDLGIHCLPMSLL